MSFIFVPKDSEIPRRMVLSARSGNGTSHYSERVFLYYIVLRRGCNCADDGCAWRQSSETDVASGLQTKYRQAWKCWRDAFFSPLKYNKRRAGDFSADPDILYKKIKIINVPEMGYNRWALRKDFCSTALWLNSGFWLVDSFSTAATLTVAQVYINTLSFL